MIRKTYKNVRERCPLPPLPEVIPEIVVSLTSFKHRIAKIIPTLKSLQNQTIKHKTVLYIAFEDKPLVTSEIESLCEVHYCEDTRSHKKLNGLFEYPDCYVATADDDLLYMPNWLEMLLRGCMVLEGAVSGVGTYRLNEYGNLNFVSRLVNKRVKSRQEHLYVMTGAGVMFPPNIDLHELKEAWKYVPLSDEKPLSALLKYKNIPVIATCLNASELYAKSYSDNICLWKQYNSSNQKERFEQARKFIKAINEKKVV